MNGIVEWKKIRGFDAIPNVPECFSSTSDHHNVSFAWDEALIDTDPAIFKSLMVLDRRFEGTQVRFVENFSLEFHSIYEFRRRQRARKLAVGIKLDSSWITTGHTSGNLFVVHEKHLRIAQKNKWRQKVNVLESFALFGRFDKISRYLESIFERSLMIISTNWWTKKWNCSFCLRCF
jgi:hypothetical protein